MSENVAGVPIPDSKLAREAAGLLRPDRRQPARWMSGCVRLRIHSPNLCITRGKEHAMRVWEAM
jgi:hypothetical protein